MCITSKIYFALREEKKRKLPEIKVLMLKTVRRFILLLFIIVIIINIIIIIIIVVLYYNDLEVGFQRMLAAFEKKILRFLINMPDLLLQNLV